jgi:uncharacterized protein (TIGR00730 family)
MKRVCVFCGSSNGNSVECVTAAGRLGRILAERELGLVYGGGNVGLMGTLANAAMEAGAEVIGVIPQTLVDRELAHRGITELRIVRSMHERKAVMADLADAFVALPGGFGTLDEFCEVLTWAQLRFHSKPCALLNVAGFYDGFLAHVDHATRCGFIHPSDRRDVIVASDPAVLLDRLTESAVRSPPPARPAVER